MSLLKLHAIGTREPLAAKVPEITVIFWIIKVLTTGMGEACSDFLANTSIVAGSASRCWPSSVHSGCSYGRDEIWLRCIGSQWRRLPCSRRWPPTAFTSPAFRTIDRSTRPPRRWVARPWPVPRAGRFSPGGSQC